MLLVNVINSYQVAFTSTVERVYEFLPAGLTVSSFMSLHESC